MEGEQGDRGVTIYKSYPMRAKALHYQMHAIPSFSLREQPVCSMIAPIVVTSSTIIIATNKRCIVEHIRNIQIILHRTQEFFKLLLALLVQ
mmetsp:Transcript_35692/g.66106  ORF Transcript_35692/g.66106 Transcript_35692/m.66106 type:complete len:91 (-) Transcript_35692:321-593(-)